MDVYMQASHLKSETETYEEKEQQLVNDCVKELSKFCVILHLSLCLYYCFHVSSVDGCFPLSVSEAELNSPLPSVLSGLSSLQISAIAEELARKTEDASRQQEEITHLLSQIVDLQKKAKSVSIHTFEFKCDYNHALLVLPIQTCICVSSMQWRMRSSLNT